MIEFQQVSLVRPEPYEKAKRRGMFATMMAS
jgi:hypothetical protein